MAVMVNGFGGSGERWVDITDSLTVQTYSNKLKDGTSGGDIASMSGVRIDPEIYGQKFRIRAKLSSDPVLGRPAPCTYYIDNDAYFMPLVAILGDFVTNGAAYVCYMEYVVVVPATCTEVYIPVIDTTEGIVVERAV